MARILVVEPSLLDRKRITTLLTAAGHEMVEVGLAAEADARLHAHPRGYFHLMITDLDLPGAHALEWIRRLKAAPHGADLPILVVSVQVPRERVVETILAGAEHMVTKPFAGDVLLRRVTEVLEGQRLLRQGEAGALTWTVTDFLRREFKRARRTGLPLALLLAVTSGNPREVAEVVKALARSLRESDVVYRLSQDRFMVFLPDTDLSGAQRVEQRLRSLVAEMGTSAADAPPLTVHLATGIAVHPLDATDVETLLTLAEDRALGRHVEDTSGA